MILLPQNFDLSEAAKSELHRLTQSGAEHRRALVENIVLALMWVDGDLNNNEIDSQVGIGLFQRDELEPGAIAVIDGIALTVAMSDKDLVRFHNKRLDVVEGCLTLVDRTAS